MDSAREIGSTDQGVESQPEHSLPTLKMLSESSYCVLFAGIALFFAFTGVRFRDLLSRAICISLMFYFILPQCCLLRFWPLDNRHPNSDYSLTVFIILAIASVIVAIVYGVLAFCIPEISVLVIGVLGSGLTFDLLGLGSLGASFGRPLFWLIKVIEGALGAACAYYFEPYAMIVGTAVIGSTVLCRIVEDIYGASSIRFSLGWTETPVSVQPVLVAVAIGVQLLMGNHRRTCKQLWDERAAEASEDAPSKAP